MPKAFETVKAAARDENSAARLAAARGAGYLALAELEGQLPQGTLAPLVPVMASLLSSEQSSEVQRCMMTVRSLRSALFRALFLYVSVWTCWCRFYGLYMLYRDATYTTYSKLVAVLWAVLAVQGCYIHDTHSKLVPVRWAVHAEQGCYIHDVQRCFMYDCV